MAVKSHRDIILNKVGEALQQYFSDRVVDIIVKGELLVRTHIFEVLEYIVDSMPIYKKYSSRRADINFEYFVTLLMLVVAVKIDKISKTKSVSDFNSILGCDFNLNSIHTKMAVEIYNHIKMPIYEKYSYMNEEIVNKLYELSQGKASPTKIPVQEKLEDGSFRYATDENGNVIYQEVHRVVTPLVQLQSAKELYEVLKSPEDKAINVNVNSKVAIEVAQKEVDLLESIAKQQQQALLQGVNIDAVQQIGEYIIDAEIDKGDE